MRSIAILFFALFVLTGRAQLNISFVGHLSYQDLRSSDLANIWGYTDEMGNEYALVGVDGTGVSNPGGLSVVDLSDPANPQEIFFYPGPASIWREIKVWNDHAYVTTEAESGGITIVDLSPLPQSTALTGTLWQAPDWTTAHSLFIDENGRLYLHGSDRGNGGVIMYDLTQDPMNPVEVGEFDQWYCHDSFARGDTLYAAHIYDGFFSIVDVSDPAAPILLGTQDTPNQFTHNTWLDDSGHHLFTTDEQTNSYVGSYDVTDPTDIQEVDRLRSDNGSGAIPHNTYWLNDFVVTSYYTYGVSIYDATYPDNMVEVGNYDTSPFSGDGFNGAWGVYPFFDSQNLIISDIEGGLYVLAPTYVHACWLQGNVSNSQTTGPVGGATVTILGPSVVDVTGLDGTYATGYATSGSYVVQVSAPGYLSATVNDVVLVNGEVTLLDVELEPLVPFSMQGFVVEEGTLDPIPGAQVVIQSPTYSFNTVADGSGAYTFPAIFQDDYSITAGKWGWHTVCLPAQTLTPVSGSVTIELPAGYADDFALNLGWTATSNAGTGAWERGVPVATFFENSTSNPGSDVIGDCGEQAYITGNGGGGAGDDDVDDGSVTLTSPVFDATGMIDAHVTYQRWFFNAGGAGTPNDRMEISLTNGTSTVLVETITLATAGMGSWQPANIVVADHLPVTSTMRLLVVARDDSPGHLVEGALDLFQLTDEGVNAVAGIVREDALIIAPNPNDGHFEIILPGNGQGSFQLFDAVGKRVLDAQPLRPERSAVQVDVPTGIYSIRVTMADERVLVRRLVVNR
ncbi:MAG: choice-of-anchor B family protein [Flavobacteriales bacterium]